MIDEADAHWDEESKTEIEEEEEYEEEEDDDEEDDDDELVLFDLG